VTSNSKKNKQEQSTAAATRSATAFSTAPKTSRIIFYHLDHLDTPQVKTDESGAVVWQADYMPFGGVNVTVDAVENNFRFQGQYYDQETGLHYNYHRDYDPTSGRYLTPDPIGLAAGIDLYSYSENNPINLIDPMGLAGIAIDFGGSYITGWGGSSGEGGGAGTGIYFGAKNWYAEFGGFSYQQFLEDTGKTPAAALGAGANLTFYFTDAEKFFPGKMDYTSYVIGPFAMTFSEDPCSGEVTGVTFSLGGKGFGWAIHSKGSSLGLQGILQ